MTAVVAAAPVFSNSDSFDNGSAKSFDTPESVPRRIVLITIDALRQDAVGAYSGLSQSPHIDELAADAVVFENARSSSPWTHPAMAGLMTGVTPWVHGVRGSRDSIAGGILTLAERLRDAGFLTAGIGHNWFLTERGSASRMNQGFLQYRFTPILPQPQLIGVDLWKRSLGDPFDFEFTTVELGRRAEAWLRRAPQDQSYFLWVHFYDPHAPYAPPADFILEKDVDPQVRKIRRPYQGEVRYVDAQVGRLLGALRDLGIYDGTYVALTSDHGDEFLEHGGFDHGHTMFDELLRVPLIIKPDGPLILRREQALVSTVALAPTLLTAMSVAYDPADFAFSALPVQVGEEVPAAVYAAGTFTGNQLEAVVFDHYKYIREIRTGREWLFDLGADPGETVNLKDFEPEALATGRALLGKHAIEAAERARRLGVGDTPKRKLDRRERELLKSLGYIQ